MGATTTEAVIPDSIHDAAVRRFLIEKWEVIDEQFAPRHFIVFGSRTKGTPHEWSDIDLIVVSDRFATVRFVRRSYLFRSLVRPDIGTTVLCYTPDEFEQLQRSIGVVADACKEGVWIK